MNSIPVAVTPPTQPVMPPPPLGGTAADIRARSVRQQALFGAIQYAAAGMAVTVGQFWQAVDAFEQYIGTGVHQ